MKLTILGTPRTKKNSNRIIYAKGHYMVIPSAAYKGYERDCLAQIHWDEPIDYRVNVKCMYYMQSRRRVDLNNLLEATTDILVKANVLVDDNCNIVAGHDGSRVLYDRYNPRVEIEIEEMKK